METGQNSTSPPFLLKNHLIGEPLVEVCVCVCVGWGHPIPKFFYTLTASVLMTGSNDLAVMPEPGGRARGATGTPNIWQIS